MTLMFNQAPPGGAGGFQYGQRQSFDSGMGAGSFDVQVLPPTPLATVRM